MKTTLSKILPILIAFFLIKTTASAATLYVSTGGNDASPGTSWALAKRTVQAAIDSANALDQIWVAAGTCNDQIVNRQVGGVEKCRGDVPSLLHKNAAVSASSLAGRSSGRALIDPLFN